MTRAERLALFLGLAAMACIPLATLAHEDDTGFKYSAFCCNGNSMTGDCAPIPDEDVVIDAEQQAFIVTLHPGDHPLVTREHVFVVRYSDIIGLSGQPVIRPEQGDRYHVCLFPDENTLRCFHLRRQNG